MAKSALKDASKQSRYEAGETIKTGLLDKLKAEGDRIQKGYNELKPVLKNIEVTPELKKTAIDSVMSNEMLPLDKKLSGLAEDLTDKISAIKNVNDAKIVRTYINNELEAAMPKIGAVDSNKAGVLLAAKNALTDLREGAINAAEGSTQIGLEGAENATSENLMKLRKLDSEWGAHKQQLLQLGNEAGLGKPSSTRTLLNQLNQVSSESLTKKFLDAQDVNSLKFIKENFPEQFDVARKYKLREIQDAVETLAKGRNKAIDTGAFLNQIKDSKMGPEAKTMIFDGVNPQHLKDIELLYTGALPPNYNLSGTAAATVVGHLFSPAGLVNNATDMYRYAKLKGLPYLHEAVGGASKQAVSIATDMAMRSGAPIEPEGFKALVDYVQHTIRGETAVSDGVKSIFEAGKIVLPTKIPDKETRQKLADKIDELVANPDPMFDIGGKTAHYAPDHGTALAQTASQAVNYLNSLKPNIDKKNPLDTEMKPDPIKQAQYNRALDIAQSPLLALKGIKNGNVNPADVITMKNIYPALYQKLSNKMNEQLIETVHQGKTIPYKTRLGISSFIGQPLDSTMTPQSLQAVAMSNQSPNPQSQQQPGQQHHRQGLHSSAALGKLPQGFATPGQSREMARSTPRT